MLDPSALEPSREELDVTGWVQVAGIDWGDAAIEAYMSDYMVGSSPVDYRLPNRQIQIPLALKDVDVTTFATIRAGLQHKVGLFQRDGGWIMRQINGVSLYADIVNASLHLGGSWLQAYRGIDVDATLQLETLPEFYGDEVTLDSASTSGTGVLTNVLQASGVTAQIEGNMPSRCRIVVGSGGVNDQLAMVWGFRSKHYDSAATAALFYEAETMTPLDAAAVATVADASGGATNNVVQHPSLPAGSWCPVLYTDLVAGGALTHRGSYRVWARCYSDAATPQLRLVWAPANIAHPITNDAVQLPRAGSFFLLDFGEIRLDAPPVGSWQWEGVFQANALTAGDKISIDQVILQPLDESSGKVIAVLTNDSPFGIESVKRPGTAANDAAVGTVDWSNPTFIESAGQAGAGARVTGTSTSSHYLKATNFGFAIPAGATISGIEVQVTKVAVGVATDNKIQLVKAGTIQTPNQADTVTPWPNASGDFTYGDETDLWSGTWTPTDINNSGFGVAISATLTGASTAVLYAATITVYYTTAGGFTTRSDAVMYAGKSAELRTDGMFREIATASGIYGPISSVIGDLPRVPVAGLEDRTVELLVKLSRGDLAARKDIGQSGFHAQVIYRPCYLFAS